MRMERVKNKRKRRRIESHDKININSGNQIIAVQINYSVVQTDYSIHPRCFLVLFFASFTSLFSHCISEGSPSEHHLTDMRTCTLNSIALDQNSIEGPQRTLKEKAGLPFYAVEKKSSSHESCLGNKQEEVGGKDNRRILKSK